MTERDPATVQLRGNLCLVRAEKAQEKTASGLIIAGKPGARKKVLEGVLFSRGDKAPAELAGAEGKRVLVHGYAQRWASLDWKGDRFDVYHGDDVLAVKG